MYVVVALDDNFCYFCSNYCDADANDARCFTLNLETRRPQQLPRKRMVEADRRMPIGRSCALIANYMCAVERQPLPLGRSGAAFGWMR